MSLSVTASAPAKTNLALHVGAPGADGYHPLETLFAAVTLRETVTATLAPEPAGGAIPAASSGAAGGAARSRAVAAGPLVTVSPAPDSEYARMTEAGSTRLEDVPTDDSNLATRAARAVCADHGCPPDIAARLVLHILKAVPVAGGMGGGSADAAAALVAVDGLLSRVLGREPLGRDRLLELGARLGADVPFLLSGGLAVGRGTGTQLEPVPTTGTLHLVFVPQDRGLSTPAVYRSWDAQHTAGHGPAGPEPLDPALVTTAAAGDARGLAPLVRNDLQAPALELLPELAAVLADGAGLGALAGWVSGSGPTVCFLAASAHHAQRLATALHPNHPHAFTTAAPARGALVGSVRVPR